MKQIAAESAESRRSLPNFSCEEIKAGSVVKTFEANMSQPSPADYRIDLPVRIATAAKYSSHPILQPSMRDARFSSWQEHSCFAKFFGLKWAYESSKYSSREII